MCRIALECMDLSGSTGFSLFSLMTYFTPCYQDILYTLKSLCESLKPVLLGSVLWSNRQTTDGLAGRRKNRIAQRRDHGRHGKLAGAGGLLLARDNVHLDRGHF